MEPAIEVTYTHRPSVGLSCLQRMDRSATTPPKDNLGPGLHSVVPHGSAFLNRATGQTPDHGSVGLLYVAGITLR